MAYTSEIKKANEIKTNHEKGVCNIYLSLTCLLKFEYLFNRSAKKKIHRIKINGNGFYGMSNKYFGEH